MLEVLKAYPHKLERDGSGDVSLSACEEVDKGHGRLEVRRYQHFNEDECQLNAAAVNAAIIKRFCMNLIVINDPSKEAMKRKAMSCAISDQYREQILFAG